MSRTVLSDTEQWYNDYLDLYNIAGQWNDKAWQEEILRILRNGRQEIASERHTTSKQALWREFQALNGKLLELFAKLKETSDLAAIEQMRETMWRLKLRRIEVGRKLAASKQ